MPVHIGNIIKEEAQGQGLTSSQVAERINVKNAQNVDYDYKKESLPLDKILLYAEALNKNFIAHYYDKEPLKTYRAQEFAAWQSKIDELQEKLNQAEKLIAAKEETIAAQNETITTQKEFIETQQRLIEKHREEHK